MKPTEDIWKYLILMLCESEIELEAEFSKRRKLGIERYGVPLSAFNGRDALVDLKEELLDAIAYNAQAMMEQVMPFEEGYDIYTNLLNMLSDVLEQIDKRRDRFKIDL